MLGILDSNQGLLLGRIIRYTNTFPRRARRLRGYAGTSPTDQVIGEDNTSVPTRTRTGIVSLGGRRSVL